MEVDLSVNGNHYGWGYQDGYEGHTNWFSRIPDEQRDVYPDNFPGAVSEPGADFGDAYINDPLTADEFIDLTGYGYTGQYGYDLHTLYLDAGPAGRSYTIEPYQGNGYLAFYNGEIRVGNDAGNDVIACKIYVSGNLPISGNKLLISGSITGDNPGRCHAQCR